MGATPDVPAGAPHVPCGQQHVVESGERREQQERLEDVILEALAGLDVPIALGLSSGHTTHPLVTLPFGVRARLTCGDEARFEVLEAAVS